MTVINQGIQLSAMDDCFQMFTELLEYINALIEGIGEHSLLAGHRACQRVRQDEDAQVCLCCCVLSDKVLHLLEYWFNHPNSEQNNSELHQIHYFPFTLEIGSVGPQLNSAGKGTLYAILFTSDPSLEPNLQQSYPLSFLFFHPRVSCIALSPNWYIPCGREVEAHETGEVKRHLMSGKGSNMGGSQRPLSSFIGE